MPLPMEVATNARRDSHGGAPMDTTALENMLGIHPNVYETKEKYTTVDPDHTSVENDISRSVEISHNYTEETDAHKNTHTKGSDVHAGSGCRSRIISMIPRHDLPRAQSQFGKRGVLQINKMLSR